MENIMSTLKLKFLGSVLVGAMICIPSMALAAGGSKKAEGQPGYKLENLTQYVNPFSGTGKDGDTYPGSSAPFGMIQWSPDAGSHPVLGGYNYADSTIYGFSLDHLSGAGCYFAENFAFMPVPATQKIVAPKDRYAFSTPFSHKNEWARPGYYGVKLDNGIKVQLTTTTRTGFGSFTYPGRGPATMTINAASNVRPTYLSFIRINPSERSVSGAALSGGFCGSVENGTIYFYAVFNRPFKSYTTWTDGQVHKGAVNGDGPQSGAYITFNMGNTRTVLAKVAISYVSMANAKANIEAESPVSQFTSKDFEKAVAAAGKNWNMWLNKIQVEGGTKEEMRTFYSMMYHTMLGPTVCSDANGQYMGYDGKVHTGEDGHVQYANFSGWDIYRSEAQFLAMIAPKHASDMAQSLLLDYQQGGAFPRWGVPNMDSGVMMGDPAAPIIADFYAFGARDFDVKAALAGLVKAATDPKVYAPRSHTHERDGLTSYLKLGYVPEFQRGGYGNVSMTLEYNSADFALSCMANSLGDTSDARMLLDHAQFWKNLYNPASGYMQMRRRNGSWAPGFKDDVQSYDGDQAYVEGTAAQYVWMVPFNLKGLAGKMGGLKTAATRLDTFFTKLNDGTHTIYAYLGNEPCLETPWEYNFFGEPYKTQEIVRRAMTELFSSKPVGYPGNDDLGEMSSWYIFGALGMYPELPGSDILVIGSPLFKKAVIHLKDGEVVIEGHGAAANAPYVQSLEVNGKKWDKTWIRFSDISHGGTMKYELGTTPNTSWGSAPEDMPPSYN